jgi:hypothetical protein
MKNTTAYWSDSLGSWVRLERCEDGEYCHTSGYETREQALGQTLYEAPAMPSFLAHDLH